MTGNVVPLQAAVPGLRKKVDRILQTVWSPPAEPVPNPDDTALIAAAWEFRRLQRFNRVVEGRRTSNENRAVFRANEREIARLDNRWNALFDFIYETPAAGLAGAAVKLRMLTDRQVGVCDLLDDAGTEADALRDIRRVVERELKQRA